MVVRYSWSPRMDRRQPRPIRDAKVLAVLSPAGIGPEYFREIAAVLASAGDGPPDRAQMGEIMRRHGLIPAPPPPGA